jgi:eukaryotic-like serine/threonine-protein kinase
MNESTEVALVGRTIAGKFLVESLIGGGAMGEVYRARQIALDKTVAIKVMHPERARDAMYAALFQREARLASKLDHPNSVRVVDFGQESDGLLYIAMEYFAGRDLLRVLSEDWPLSAPRIADILSQALAGIAVAHDLGVVHRDLKPENILVQRGADDDGSSRDIVKVCDFGIAKFTEPGEAVPAREGPRLTEGVVIGTPHYMSPEQCQGMTLDARTDIYSMGVILYQVLTARVPFEGKTLVDVVVKHVRDTPIPPTRQAAWVDPRLEAICLKALKKKREDRYQSAREMRAHLRAVLAAPALAPELPGPVSRDAPTLPPPDDSASAAWREGSKLPLEPSTSKVTPPPAASVVRPKGRRAGAAAALFAATVAVAGATGLILRTSRSPAVVASLAPSAVVAPDLSTQPPPSPKESALAMTAPPPTAPQPTPRATLGPTPPTKEPARARAWAGAPLAVKHTEAATEPADSTRADIAEPPPAPPPPAAPRPLPSAAPPTLASTTAPTLAASPAVPPRPFDPAEARVDWLVASTGGGATATEVRRALARSSRAWNACYQNAIRTGGQRVEGSGVLHITTDDDGNVVQANVMGFTLPNVGPCIAAAASVRVGGVDTGSAWADIRLTFRAEPSQ